jgi:hypothetical protein
MLNTSRDNPIIHLKAYGGVQIDGIDRNEVQCEIDAPQLATLVEEDGHVYITVNSSCNLKVPVLSSIEIEKGMGSIKITHVTNQIKIERALGNVVLMDIGEAAIEKVGGTFAVKNTSGDVSVEKIGGNFIADGIESFSCEKIGGSCFAKDVRGDFSLEKIGGELRAQDITGVSVIPRVGGSFLARGIKIGEDIRAGGNIHLNNFEINSDRLSLKAGGSISLMIGKNYKGSEFDFNSGAREINIQINDNDLHVGDGHYSFSVGDTSRILEASSGGAISLTELVDEKENIVGDLSDYFSYEESTFSGMIQERVKSATRMAEAKVKAAEIRLEKMRERVEKHRGFHVDVDLNDIGEPPAPSVTRQVGKKGASDEERLMILKMLQDKKITVDEAETLFKALED